MRLQIKTKQTKRSFESLLIKLYGVKNLTKRETYEENIKLTLYYDTSNTTVSEINGKRYEFDEHIGTWHKDGGWYSKPEKN